MTNKQQIKEIQGFVIVILLIIGIFSVGKWTYGFIKDEIAENKMELYKEVSEYVSHNCGTIPKKTDINPWFSVGLSTDATTEGYKIKCF